MCSHLNNSIGKQRKQNAGNVYFRVSFVFYVFANKGGTLHYSNSS